MSNPSEFAQLLDRIIRAGHDIAIVGSTVPRRSELECTQERDVFGCNEEFLETALGHLYEMYGDRSSRELLKESVARILRWKLDMYVNLDRLRNVRHGDPLNAILSSNYEYKPSQRREQTAITGDLKELTEDVLGGAVSLVTSPEYRDGRSINDLGLSESSNVLCVGPKFARNDLKLALETTVTSGRIDCVDLDYNSTALGHPKEFEQERARTIKGLLMTARESNGPYDVVIFGLSDIPAHQEVAKDVARVLKEHGDSVAKNVVWIAFDSPIVLNDDFVARDHYALATFSNSAISNMAVVNVLFRSYDYGVRENVPVEIADFVDHVEPISTCRRCEQPILQGLVSAKALFAFLGAIVAILALRYLALPYLHLRIRPPKEQWMISVLAGFSGFTLFFAGSVVEIDLSSIWLGDVPVSVDMGSGIHFAGPLVLSFIAFGFLYMFPWLLRRHNTSHADERN